MESKKVKVYSGKHLFWHCLQQSFYKTVSQIFLNLFRSGDKRLLSDFTQKWGWFHGHYVRFPNNLGSRLKFQKTEARFCRWKSNDYDISNFLSLENPCTFLLGKGKTWKRIFKTNCEWSRNHTEKQFMPSKTSVNWLFNDIWCYLVIGCFDKKICVLQ